MGRGEREGVLGEREGVLIIMRIKGLRANAGARLSCVGHVGITDGSLLFLTFLLSVCLSVSPLVLVFIVILSPPSLFSCRSINPPP